MEIKPLGSRLLVRKDVGQKSKGGIIIPESVTDVEQRHTGIVLAVGPGKLLENGNREIIEVSVGDKILFSKYAGIQKVLNVNDEELLLMHAGDAQAILLGD